MIVAVASVEQFVLMPFQEVSGMILVALECIQAGSC
jgi:hypothetical protein